MKMFDKGNCKYKEGYIVCGEEVVAVSNEVVDLLNKLDTDIQRAEFDRKNAAPEPDVPKKFARKTEYGKVYPHIVADTPVLDKQVQKTLDMMDELDAAAAAEKCNDYFEGLQPVILFVASNGIVSCEHAEQHRFDLPVVGNPLELDKERLADLVIGMFNHG